MQQLDFPAIKQPQRDRLIDVLSDLKWHPWHELKDRCGPRYGARWGELLDAGYLGETSVLTDGSYGKRYRLTSLTPGPPRDSMVRVYLNPLDVALFLKSGQSDRLIGPIEQAYANYLEKQK
jgi:hypothetical protein